MIRSNLNIKIDIENEKKFKFVLSNKYYLILNPSYCFELMSNYFDIQFSLKAFDIKNQTYQACLALKRVAFNPSEVI